MQSTVEESGRHTVVVTVEVPPDEFAKDLDRAYRRIGQQIKVPGFRKGHVPRRIIDAQVGRDAVMQEFIEDAIPQYYSKAVREHELAPIADPEISLESSDEGKPLVFSATVEVRPRLQLDALARGRPGRRAPRRERDRRGRRPVRRPAPGRGSPRSRPSRARARKRLRAGRHPGERPRARSSPSSRSPTSCTRSARARSLPQLDEELENAGAGDILKFNATLAETAPAHPGEEVTFPVLVKEVKAKKLPAADDEFAKQASEFDTLEELRADLREKLADAKAAEARGVFRDRVLAALVDQVDIDLPDTLVDHETEHRVEEATRRAERAGLTLDQVLDAQDWDELRFRSDARAHATRAIRSDLVLEAIARQEGITVTPEEIGGAVADLAQALGRDPKEVAKTIERTGQVTSLAGDIIRTKALDLLVEAAEGAPSEAPAEAEPEGTEDPADPSPSDQGASK